MHFCGTNEEIRKRMVQGTTNMCIAYNRNLALQKHVNGQNLDCMVASALTWRIISSWVLGNNFQFCMTEPNNPPEVNELLFKYCLIAVAATCLLIHVP